MNSSLFLLFGVAFVFATVNGLPVSSGAAVSTAITNFCSVVSSKQQLATVYYTQLTGLLQQAASTFPQTLAYINNPTNKAALLVGGTSCQQFFAGLKTPLTADLQATGLSAQQVAQQIQQYVDQYASTITTVYSALTG